MPKNYRKNVKAIMAKYMDNIRRKEVYEMSLLSKAFSKILSKLDSLIVELSNLPSMSVNQLIQTAIYKEFIKTANAELLKYSGYSANVIGTVQKEFAKQGLQSSFDTMATFGVSFNKLPVEAVIQMVGRTQDGTPLAEILVKRYGDSIDAVRTTLIESNALGRNPLVTARLIGKDLEGSLYNTIRIARTEQIDTFREASREGYKESGIVTEINLAAEPDACDICLGVEENNPYPIDYEFSELHPNCRCAFSPEL